MNSKRRLRNIILLIVIVIFIGTYLAIGNPVLDQIHDTADACDGAVSICSN